MEGLFLFFRPQRGDIKRQRRGVGDIEALDRAGKLKPRQAVASRAGELTQTSSFGPEHQRHWLWQRNCRKIVRRLAVEPDGQKSALLQPGKRAGEILHDDDR